jgi:thiol-disulfide isomerase/thioredoxin
MFMLHAFRSRRFLALAVLLAAFAPGLRALGTSPNDVPKPGEPTDPKASKTYAGAIDWEKQRNYGAAMDDFRKANRQDGGHCRECLRRAYLLAVRINAFKDAEGIARDMLPQAETDQQKAAAHFEIAIALQRQGINTKKDQCFSASCDEFKAAMAAAPGLEEAHYSMGISLAHLHQDDAARQEFAAFLDKDKKSPDMHDRAERYRDRVELARAIMAPPFSLTTMDGQHVTMDGLAGKVVLIDFWATWCGPCREALPHVRQIAQRFAGQPLVVLSISLDNDDAKWRDFVAKNGMTWLQYRDGGFGGQIAKEFGVTGIPATFTIDTDGVLEDQHVGDGDIESKLKKLVARAAEAPKRNAAPLTADKAPGAMN